MQDGRSGGTAGRFDGEEMTTTGMYAQSGNTQPGTPPGLSSTAQLVVLPDGTQPIPLASGKVISVLGEGGAAIVYEIWNEILGVKRAVKILRPNAMPQSFERFNSEMRITAQLRHPNIIEIHAVGSWNNLPFIEMERLEGNSLDKVIQAYGALPVPVVLAIGIMICRALKYTHTHDYAIGDKHYKGILHRDLKPANTMISENGVAKLMDFGIATPTNASMHTMEGTFVGSLQYLAPEQLEGKKASPSSDLYAFGAMMYEMLTGQQAFAERNMTKLIAQRLKNEYKPLADFHLKLPSKLIRVVNQCMAFERDRRAGDAAKVLAKLEPLLAEYTRKAPEDITEYFLRQAKDGGKRTIRFRKRIPFGRILMVLMVLGAIGAGGYYGWLEREQLAQLRLTTANQRTDSVVIEKTVAETVFVKERATTPPPAPTATATTQAVQERTAPKTAFVYRDAQQGRPSAAPERTPTPEPARVAKSFLVLLTEKYGTDDLLAIMAMETSAGNHASAVRLYDSLGAEQRKSKRAQLYRMRGLQGLGNGQRLGDFFETTSLVDAEYYLAKAQYQYGLRRYREAMGMLDACKTTQAEFLEQPLIQRESVYYKALCLTGLASADGTEAMKSAAMEAWYDVKFALRNEQNHRYFKYANDQIRRMSTDSEE